MAVNTKRVFYVKYLASPTYAEALAQRPDVRLDRLENDSADAVAAPILAELAPLVDVEDRAVTDRPDVLDAVDAGIGRADGVPAVGGHGQAETMRLVYRDLDQIHRQKFVEFY